MYSNPITKSSIFVTFDSGSRQVDANDDIPGYFIRMQQRKAFFVHLRIHWD